MRIAPLAPAFLLLLATPAFSAADPAQAAVSPTAGSAPNAALQNNSATAEEAVEDDAQDLSPTAKLDLPKAETRLLSKISTSMALNQDKVLFNLEENAPSDKAGIGVDEVDVKSLYRELAQRALAEDKDARQALTLAILRGDDRAKDAKNQAYEDRLAESLIKRIGNGDSGAKEQLMTQAQAGNEKARLYFGMDAGDAAAAHPLSASSNTPALAGSPASLSPSAAGGNPAAGLSPVAAGSPAAGVAVADAPASLSGPAASGAAAPLSPPAGAASKAEGDR